MYLSGASDEEIMLSDPFVGLFFEEIIFFCGLIIFFLGVFEYCLELLINIIILIRNNFQNSHKKYFSVELDLDKEFRDPLLFFVLFFTAFWGEFGLKEIFSVFISDE